MRAVEIVEFPQRNGSGGGKRVRFPVTVMLSGSAHELHAEVQPDARVEDLARALAAHFATPGEVGVATAAGPLDADASLVDAGVRAGALLHVTLGTGPGAAAPATGQAAGRRLRVVAGPDAGVVFALPGTGTVTIGRTADNDVQLTGTGISRRHAALRVGPGGVEVSDTGSSNGTTLDGARLTAPARLVPGAVLRIGRDELVLDLLPADAPATDAPDAARPLPDGTLRVTRPHRFVPAAPVVTVDLPRRPDERRGGTAAVGIGAAGGLVLGVVAFLVWHNAMFLLFSGVSTVTLLATGVWTWWRGRSDSRREQQRFRTASDDRQAELTALLTEERQRLLEQSPDVAGTVLLAQHHDARLWQRRPTHDDFLRLRIGVADQPSQITVRDPSASPDAPPVQQPVQPQVPVLADLGTAGTVGIAGPRAQARALARWLLLQAVVQSGPADLSVAVLTRAGDAADDTGAAASWDWVRWLPHARPDTGPLARVGVDTATLTHQVETLAAVVAARRRPDAQPRRFGHNWLVVVDNLPEFDVPGLADVLAHGPDAGVFIVAVGQLPYRCPITVDFTDAARVRLRRMHQPDLDGVVADQVSAVAAERAGRALAPLRDPETQHAGGGMPAEVALLDLADTADLDARWRRRPRQTRVAIGRTGDGPLNVDIAAHGPHLLVAGATGWGKSAFLQSLIGALALANRPDELGFVLVDFKGGAAFAAFADLPHTVGSISNLDGRQVMRALDSLAGELDRRQRYLAAAGVEKLELYQQRADAGTLPPGCPPRLPRLLVVIDEFAMLKEQLPAEILTRLVHVATVGRSLGLHLVIGTQTPRGVVPAEIRPNINLQVALHLPAEHSLDVIGRPDASTLTGKGQAYLRRGEDTDLVLFQSAFLGGGTRRAPGERVRLIRSPWPRLGYPPADAARSAARDVDVLVDAVRAAAPAAGVSGPERPWLDELSAALPLSSVPLSAPSGLVFGREDQPELRAQPAAVWDLHEGTNLLVAGRPRSGRSTFLRTVAAAALRTGEIHIYVMDCGGTLGDLAALPHCGAVVDAGQLDRGARLLARLEALIRERERGGGPRTLLLVDDWDTWLQTFGEVDHGTLYDALVRIARKGPAVGVHVAVAGSGALLTSGRFRALTESSRDLLALPFAPGDHALLGIPATAVPGDQRPGQAIRLTGRHRIVQVAVADPGVTAAAVTIRPWRVDELPDQISVASAATLPRDSSPSGIPAGAGGTSPSWVPAGVGGDDLHLLGVDLTAEGPGFYVTGERRSGRSTALLGIALDLLSRGTQVVILAPVRTSPLHALSGVPGVAAILGVRQPSVRQAQLALAAAGTTGCVVLVDDAEHLLRGDAGAVLREFLLETDPAHLGMVVAAAVDDLAAPPPGSFAAEAGRSGAGLLLGPRQPRAHLFNTVVKIPQAYVTADPPGRGVLIRPRGMAPVQVPYATTDDAAALVAARPRRVPQLLGITDALAGPAPTTVPRLRSIVAELLAAGFDALEPAAATQALELAGAGFTGSPTELLAKVRPFS
ncbi:FtsK/SpoIIIE domain-containing protein [Dactylosporangium maewongense]|uniref:FtsK/SpoIIIE domain-containing protein n=1 Tax=Dactylosporangium maewongense TaxID=634393 RepID=A0ABN2D9U0_9ACTN